MKGYALYDKVVGGYRPGHYLVSITVARAGATERGEVPKDRYRSDCYSTRVDHSGAFHVMYMDDNEDITVRTYAAGTWLAAALQRRTYPNSDEWVDVMMPRCLAVADAQAVA